MKKDVVFCVRSSCRVSEDLYYYFFQFVASLNLVCDGGYFIML